MWTITTNHHRRPVLQSWELTEAERTDNDVPNAEPEVYNDDRTWVRYRGTLYPLSDFQATTANVWGGNAELRALGWDGYLTDSFFSGVVIRYTDDGTGSDEYGYVVMGTMYHCDCSEEYGPCASHSEEIAQRVGSSNRSADELCAVFIDDALAALQSAEYVFPRAQWEDIDAMRARLDNPESWEGSWLREDAIYRDDDTVSLSEAMRDMADRDLTDALGTVGLSVYWDDGYRIIRITGGPLAQ